MKHDGVDKGQIQILVKNLKGKTPLEELGVNVITLLN
jgi:hypothetical protein